MTTTDTTLLAHNGYVQLTNEYILPDEEEMFERAKAQLEKNSRSYVCVSNDIGTSIWVKKPFGGLQFTDYTREEGETS